MTLSELKKQVEKYILKGYGEKEIYIENDAGGEYDIDSIQQNTMPSVEPEYLIIMKI